MGRYEWPDGSTVDALDYCEELDKWRGDDFEFLADPDFEAEPGDYFGDLANSYYS